MNRWKQSWSSGWQWLRNQDLVVLVVSLVAALGLWGFAEIADEVSEGSMRQLDERILLAFRNPANLADPIGPEWLEVMVRDITALGGVAVIALLTLAVGGYIAIRRQFHALWLMAAAVGGGLLVNLAAKIIFGRTRPEIVPHLMHESSASFPSGHSMLSAVVYLTLAALLARLVEPVKVRVYLLFVAILLSFLVGVSRAYLGVHYPTDILAGWTLGIFWALLCWLFARFLQKRGTVEPRK